MRVPHTLVSLDKVLVCPNDDNDLDDDEVHFMYRILKDIVYRSSLKKILSCVQKCMNKLKVIK